MAQLSYNLKSERGFRGMKADSQFHFVEGTKLAQAAIGLGLGVVKVAGDDNLVRLPTGGDTEIEGISLHTFQLIADRTTGVVEYSADDPVNILRRGAIYAYVDDAVSADDPVYCRHTVDGAKDPGMFGNAASIGANGFLVTGARFKETITAAGIAVIELNLPQG